MNVSNPNAKQIYSKVISETEKTFHKDRFHTTSFTMMKKDYDRFQAVCKRNKRKPSVVIRCLIELFIAGEIGGDS